MVNAHFVRVELVRFRDESLKPQDRCWKMTRKENRRREFKIDNLFVNPLMQILQFPYYNSNYISKMCLQETWATLW